MEKTLYKPPEWFFVMFDIIRKRKPIRIFSQVLVEDCDHDSTIPSTCHIRGDVWHVCCESSLRMLTYYRINVIFAL